MTLKIATGAFAAASLLAATVMPLHAFTPAGSLAAQAGIAKSAASSQIQETGSKVRRGGRSGLGLGLGLGLGTNVKVGNVLGLGGKGKGGLLNLGLGAKADVKVKARGGKGGRRHH